MSQSPIEISIVPASAMMAAVIGLIKSGSLTVEATGLDGQVITLRVVQPVAATATAAPMQTDLLSLVEAAATKPPHKSEAEQVTERLSQNPALRDVCAHMLFPLARKYQIDGPVEPQLMRMANEFCTYAPSQLKRATAILLTGKHVYLPDYGEVYAALGRAVKPITRAIEAGHAA